MEIYFRLVEAAGVQVFLEKHEDDDETDVIIIVFHLEGVKVKNTYGYSTQQERDKVFDEIDIEQVTALVEGARKLF